MAYMGDGAEHDEYGYIKGLSFASWCSNYATHSPAPLASTQFAAQLKEPGMMAQIAAATGSVAIGHGLSILRHACLQQAGISQLVMFRQNV